MKKAEKKSTTSTQKRDAQSNDSYVSNYTHNLMVAQEVQEANGLKIDPTFRDLIPKLTDDEFAQLEKNILADGRVKEPIVVWNGIIIDGHHRFYVVLMHPEIPYEIEERDFKNEHAAMAWACANQLGRRNLSESDEDYLMGREYTEAKLARGGTGANRYTKVQKAQNELSVDSNKTAFEIGQRHGKSRESVKRSEKYSEGVDIAEDIVPGAKEAILHGETTIPKSVVRDIPKAKPEKQKKAVKAILEGKPNEAKQILHGDSEFASKLHDPPKEIKFTEDDLLEELTVNFHSYMDSLHSTMDIHADIMENEESKENVVNKFKELLEAEIKRLEEL